MKRELMLMDIPRESRIFCEASDGSKWITFHHLDGMYSYCTTQKGGVVHIGVMQPLIEVIGGYKLK